MKVDFICTADWHTHWKVPAARKDLFIDAQWQKIRFITRMQERYKCPVLNAGDIFDTWKDDKDSNMLELLGMADKHFPQPMFCIYGQHEMPHHSGKATDRSPLNLLDLFKRIEVIPNGQGRIHKGFRIFGSGYGYTEKVCGNPNTILLKHELVWKKEEPFPGAPPEGNVDRIMEDNPGHRLIVSGDNHQPFTHRQGYRSLINCGSLMRRTRAQRDYEPSVWLWGKQDGFKRVLLPIEKDVWHDDVDVEVGGKIFQVLETIGKASTVKDTFEANVTAQMDTLPHPTKMKVKKLMRESE